MTVDEIKLKINKSDQHNGKDDFVAAAVRYNAKYNEAVHSGIIICLYGDLHLFHFDGVKVKLEKLPDDSEWYVDKIFDFIEPDEVIPFFIHCKNIEKEANPSYGFNYNGSYFKGADAIYYSEVKDFQLMSCVGFCLNVITGIIEGNSYILHEDWGMADSDKDTYFQEYMEAYLEGVPKEEQALLKNKQRRILPSEYLACSLISETPISKKSVDAILPALKNAMTQVLLN